jgi:hypothetical protein
MVKIGKEIFLNFNFDILFFFMFVRQKQSVEPLDTYIFSMIKRLYYGDLCERMTESRDLLMVTYDFIRLFRNGQIKSNDISTILQDVQNTYEILSFLLFFYK